MIRYQLVHPVVLDSSFLGLAAACFPTRSDDDALRERMMQFLNKEYICYTALSNTTLVGAAIFVKREHSGFTLECLAVDPVFWKCHIGSTLIATFIQLHRPLSIDLETDSESLDFYLKNSFTIKKVEIKYSNCTRYKLSKQYF